VSKIKDLTYCPEITLRKLNPDCLKAGHICAIYQKAPVCLTPSHGERDKDGNLKIYSITSCKKAVKKGFDIKT
jgi:hypothetical protein